MLQHLQLMAGSAVRRWVLKTPWFLHILDSLRAEYPDAVVIQTHRPPHAFVGSSASLHAKTYGAASDGIDLRAIGSGQLALLEEMTARGMAVREAWSREPDGSAPRAVDVQLDDLKADPLGTVAQLYTSMGMELTYEARAGMEGWLASKQVRHGRHKVELADFGLSRAAVDGRPAFREYCRRFGVRGCAAVD